MKTEELKTTTTLKNIFELQREALDRLIYQNDTRISSPEATLIEMDIRFLYEGLTALESLIEQREKQVEDLNYELKKIKELQNFRV